MTNDEGSGRFDRQRAALVEQLRRQGIQDSSVLDAFRRVPRHKFVPREQRYESYGNYPVPIGEGQTISQPLMIALMMAQLRCRADCRVLEIGTGSGYQAALLCEMGAEVVSVERKPRLAWIAARVLREAGYGDVILLCGDGTRGARAYAPFDRIIVTAGAPHVPGALVDQLAARGRLVIPVGDRVSQDLIVVTKDADGRVREESHGGCVFVPLVGEDGWPRSA